MVQHVCDVVQAPYPSRNCLPGLGIDASDRSWLRVQCGPAVAVHSNCCSHVCACARDMGQQLNVVIVSLLLCLQSAEDKRKDKEPKKAEAVDAEDAEDAGGEDGKRKRAPFRRFFYRGLEVHKLLDLTHQQLMDLMTARARRRFARGHVPMHLIRRLRKAVRTPLICCFALHSQQQQLNRGSCSAASRSQKKDQAAGGAEAKPIVVKTHLRNMIVMPEMVGSTIGVYNGMGFTSVEVKVRR